MKNFQKNEMSRTIGIMIIIILIGYIYLWATSQSVEDRIEELDPKSYDVETVCNKKAGHYIICNDGNDSMYVYDDVNVYLKQVDIVIKDNGDAVTSVTYNTSTIDKIEEALEESGPITLLLWLTNQGQIHTIMIVETSFTSYELMSYGENLATFWDKTLYLMKSTFYDKIF
ncbi:MAG: hypothetical protein IKU44_05190 [Firmicutes bacterium]|nr:hypothetical protein [Bacillota bacterium]